MINLISCDILEAAAKSPVDADIRIFNELKDITHIIELYIIAIIPIYHMY